MEQFIDGGCWGNGAVWEVEFRGGYAPSWKGWICCEESTQRGTSVADRGWHCAAQYAHANVVLGRKHVNAIQPLLAGWASTPPGCAILVDVIG